MADPGMAVLLGLCLDQCGGAAAALPSLVRRLSCLVQDTRPLHPSLAVRLSGWAASLILLGCAHVSVSEVRRAILSS